MNVPRLPRYAFAALLWAGLVGSGGCENDPRQLDDLLRERAAIEEAEGVTSYLSQDGLMRARLQAPRMLRHQSDSAFVEFPSSIHVDFFDDSLQIESVLDALYANYKEYESRVFLRDSVVVINRKQGDTLRTDELWWDQQKEEFYTERKVRIFQKDKTIFGEGLRAAQDFSWYDIFQITGVVLSSGAEFGAPEDSLSRDSLPPASPAR